LADGPVTVRDGEGQIVSVAYSAMHDRLVGLQQVAAEPALCRKGFSRHARWPSDLVAAGGRDGRVPFKFCGECASS